MSTTVLSRSTSIRSRDVITSEVTKILTHPATFIAIALTLATNTLFGVVGVSAVQFGTEGGTKTLTEFPTVIFAPIYAFLVLAAYAAASEYQGGQLRMSLTATPNRARLIVCKLCALIIIVIPAALFTLLPERLILGLHAQLSVLQLLGDIAQWITVYLLMSLLTFGLATILKSAVASLSLLGTLAIFVNAGFLPWPQGARFLPDQAATNMLGTPANEVTAMSPAAGTAALTLWAIAGVVVFVVTIQRRDA